MKCICIKCGCSCFNKPLHRTNPIGQNNPGWMCMSCLEKNEKELAKNINADDGYKVITDISNTIQK